MVSLRAGENTRTLSMLLAQSLVGLMTLIGLCYLFSENRREVYFPIIVKSLLLQLFFDAKSDEIVNVFSSGPEVDFDQTAALLKKIAPFFLPKWKQIK